MKTKFIGSPIGNKAGRNKLRLKGYAHLQSLLTKLRVLQDDYDYLKYDHLIYVLPRDELRGYLSCALHDATLRFYLASGDRLATYTCDKIEYVYYDSESAQGVCFCITQELPTMTYFDWLHGTGKVIAAVLASK